MISSELDAQIGRKSLTHMPELLDPQGLQGMVSARAALQSAFTELAESAALIKTQCNEVIDCSQEVQVQDAQS